MSPELYAQVLRRAIFECCEWHTQVEDRPVLCSFPIVVDQDIYQHLAQTAERLAGEALAAEEELLERKDLHTWLGLPAPLRRCLRGSPAQGANPNSVRVMRFDFHWTSEGWRISEANTDVAGGFIEASGVTQIMAAHYPDYAPVGDPAGRLAEAIERSVKSAGPVGFMHLPCYTEDRQVMLYLAGRLQELGVSTCLFHPSQVRWTDGQAFVNSEGYRGPLSLIVRFYPAEWLPELPAASGWQGFLTGGETVTCNPASAVLTQSKRFPLVWDQLATSLTTWRGLLPMTRSPLDIENPKDGEWVFKPALGYEGRDVAINGVTEAADWQRIRRTAWKNPETWVAQRRFECLPLSTPDGLMYPCLGIYVIEGRAAGAYGRMGVRPLIDERSREIAVLVPRNRVAAIRGGGINEARNDL